MESSYIPHTQAHSPHPLNHPKPNIFLVTHYKNLSSHECISGNLNWKSWTKLILPHNIKRKKNFLVSFFILQKDYYFLSENKFSHYVCGESVIFGEYGPGSDKIMRLWPDPDLQRYSLCWKYIYIYNYTYVCRIGSILKLLIILHAQLGYFQII